MKAFLYPADELEGAHRNCCIDHIHGPRAQDGSSRTGKCLRRTSKWLYFEVVMNYLVLAVCRYQVCVFSLNPCKNPLLQPPK